jgi:hypothetical protein
MISAGTRVALAAAKARGQARRAEGFCILDIVDRAEIDSGGAAVLQLLLRRHHVVGTVNPYHVNEIGVKPDGCFQLHGGVFDSAVAQLTRRRLLPVEREAILTALVNSIGESGLRRAESAGFETGPGDRDAPVPAGRNYRDDHEGNRLAAPLSAGSTCAPFLEPVSSTCRTCLRHAETEIAKCRAETGA